MSRVGKLPVLIPDGVKVEVSGLHIKIHGPRGDLEKKFVAPIMIKQDTVGLMVVPLNDSVFAKSMWGTVRSIIHSMVQGVTRGFKTELEINGVGYKAAVKGEYLNLVLGKSHNTKIQIPSGIIVTVLKQNSIVLESNDKEILGQYVAIIRNQRPPEPYKGKGIYRKGEHIYRKVGKKG
jgi:large subunit ribosomal protein L6